MDPRRLSFLEAVVGPDGARALAKAVQDPALEWAIFPRVVMAWLEVAGTADYDDALPGVDDTKLTFKKSEAFFTGSINIGSDVYTFDNASLFHVAGSVAVALGSDADPSPALKSSTTLSRLGKSIDLLVKARTLRKAKAKTGGGAGGNQLPGAAAAPQG